MPYFSVFIALFHSSWHFLCVVIEVSGFFGYREGHGCAHALPARGVMEVTCPGSFQSTCKTLAEDPYIIQPSAVEASATL